MKKTITCRDVHGKQSVVSIDKLRFRPSVYGVLIEDNKILLSKQWDGYDFPGGGVDIHETLEEALRREFFEETGLEIEVKDCLHAETSFFNPSHSLKHKKEYWNCPLMYFLVKKVGGKISIDNFDEDEKNYADMPEWVSLSKIKDIKFFNSIDSKSIIRKANK